MDGLTAKLLHATSEFGKQLDSLSDLISFGLAPSLFIYCMFREYFLLKDPSFSLESALLSNKILLFSSFLIAVFAALRLARFNIDTTKRDDFRGLPVPANALIIVAVWISFHNNTDHFWQVLYWEIAYH